MFIILCWHGFFLSIEGWNSFNVFYSWWEMKMLYGENFGSDRAINGRHFNPRRNIEPKIWRGKNSHLKQTQFSVIIFFFLLGNLAATTTTSLTAEVFLTRKFPSSVWRWIKLKSKNWVLPLLVYLTETYTHLYKPCNLVTAGFLFIYLNWVFLEYLLQYF